MSNLFQACDCSSNGLPLYKPCSKMGGGDCMGIVYY